MLHYLIYALHKSGANDANGTEAAEDSARTNSSGNALLVVDSLRVNYAAVERCILDAIDCGRNPAIIEVAGMVGVADILGEALRRWGYRAEVTCRRERLRVLAEDPSYHAIIFERFAATDG